jgi:GNAT superfamily N-acetyltransferase
MDAVQHIFREYADSLSVDLCFQDFEQELSSLPGDYQSPRGTLLLALVDGDVAGCCALRPIDNVDYANAAEMKRLFVRKAFRRFGLGRMLAEAILDAARMAGYSTVLLDTLDDMEAARTLYEDLGFDEIPPYYHNPHAGAHYLKVEL